MPQPWQAIAQRFCSIPICPKENKNAIIDHIGYALYAFGGLGMEILLLLLEATIYGTSYTSWTSSQTVLHQLITCLFWGSIGYFLAKKLPYREKYSLSPIRRLFLLLLITGSIVITSIMWGGFKPAAEFAAMSPFTFLIQYLYYSAEAFLLFLIIAHGQQGFVLVFKKHTLFPFGGILLAITWGLVHIFTQNFSTGIYAFVQALLYGCVFTAAKKNYRLSYLVILFMFMV